MKNVEPTADDESLELTIEPLATSTRKGSGGPRLRSLLNLVSVALAALLIALGANATLSTSRTRSGATSAFSTSAPASSYSNISRHQTAGNAARGTAWRAAGPRWAQTIVFAVNAPAQAYTCGVPALASATLAQRPAAIALAVSRDAGRTWHTYMTPALGLSCDLTVDPSDAADVVLVANLDPSGNTKPLALYRTLDAGATWHAWPLPFRTTDGRGDFYAYHWAWVPATTARQRATLFVAPYFPENTIYIWLAASIAGAPFVWVEQHAIFPTQPAAAGIMWLIGTAGGLYVVLQSRTDCPPSCVDVMLTTDNGTTWRPFMPATENNVIALLSASADGATLFGGVLPDLAQPPAAYVRSTDSGVTWNSIAPVPPTLVALDLLAAPDGTLFALLEPANVASGDAVEQPGIYELAPNAALWQFVAPYTGSVLSRWYIVGSSLGNGPSIALAWDSSGHPTALWGQAHAPAPDSATAGIAYYTV